MPRHVDQESRRRRIAEAVCLLADERGLEGVTLRDVATRADVSMGAVQRCFRSKEEMLVFALGHVREQVSGRVRARLAASPSADGVALGRVTAEIALLGEEHRAEARVWLAFVAHAAVSERPAAILRDNYAELRDVLAHLIADAAGGAGPRADPRAEADRLLALADGLTTHVLIGHLDPAAALRILDDHLRDVRESVRGGGDE